MLVVAVLATAGCVTTAPPPAVDAPWVNPFLLPGQHVILQVDAVPGMVPPASLLEDVRQLMDEVGTPTSIEVSESLAPASSHDLPEILDAHSRLYSGDDHWRRGDGAVLHLLVFDGNYTGGAFVGLHVTTLPLLVVFPETVASHSLYVMELDVGKAQGGAVRSIISHEYGHVLGLVGCGLPETTPHGDGTCHSHAERSVMYPGVHDASDVATWALDDDMQPVWRFDADDWADIRAGQRAIANGT